MHKVKLIRSAIIAAIIFINIGCDQVSKNVVRHNVQYNEQISLIDGFFTLTKVENTGAFLSLGNELPHIAKMILLNIFPLLTMLAAIVFVIKYAKKSKLLLVGVCFIVGGGIGNLYDRVLHGSVTDFMHMNFGIFQTGVFNMADVSIMIGAFVCAYYSYFSRSFPQPTL
ncbi:signal peptidase II [Mucilaginibacter terrae]|uniref:Lipoprotein signal peptidase n=1 Tax=Mucilaginibacter terrae TaxID=1955052 RepID=A0ABU3GS36_9SPHI|nr:signal peptidase II [Mucilaginibacter terrae]MDT3402593.1 signal peptidase II [Mucilaginibacter terrae]